MFWLTARLTRPGQHTETVLLPNYWIGKKPNILLPTPRIGSLKRAQEMYLK